MAVRGVAVREKRGILVKQKRNMGPKVGRKRSHHGIRDIKRGMRTKARTRDLDNIFEDMESQAFAKLVNQPQNPELPGFGQNYCVQVPPRLTQCARHFITEQAKLEHIKTKLHKRRCIQANRRVKMLENGTAYTQKDAEAAVGLKTDNGPGRK